MLLWYNDFKPYFVALQMCKHNIYAILYYEIVCKLAKPQHNNILVGLGGGGGG